MVNREIKSFSQDNDTNQVHVQYVSEPPKKKPSFISRMTSKMSNGLKNLWYSGDEGSFLDITRIVFTWIGGFIMSVIEAVQSRLSVRQAKKEENNNND